MKFLLICLMSLFISCQMSAEPEGEPESSSGLVTSSSLSSSLDLSMSSSMTLSSSAPVISSSEVLDTSLVEILLSQFPRRQISQEDPFLLKWNLFGVGSRDYRIDVSYEDTEGLTTLIDSILNQDSVEVNLSFLENGSRIKLKLELYVEGFVATDESAFFDLHDGITPLTYDQDIQPFFAQYCTNCHGSSGGLRLETYEQVTEGNTPLYVMNRVNFIGDMPPQEENQPSDSEKEALRDWILGGYPK